MTSPDRAALADELEETTRHKSYWSTDDQLLMTRVVATLRAATSEEGVAREALKPLAKLAGLFDNYEIDRRKPGADSVLVNVKLDDLRKARAALRSPSPYSGAEWRAGFDFAVRWFEGEEESHLLLEKSHEARGSKNTITVAEHCGEVAATIHNSIVDLKYAAVKHCSKLPTLPRDADTVKEPYADFNGDLTNPAERPTLPRDMDFNPTTGERDNQETDPAYFAPRDAERETITDEMIRAGRAAHHKYGCGAVREIFTAMVAALPSIPPREGPLQSTTEQADASRDHPVRENCDWPDAPFTFHDEPGEHDPCYVVMPGGAMLSLNHHAGEGVDIARAKFIVAACNAALQGQLPFSPAHLQVIVTEAMLDSWNDICSDTGCHPLDIEQVGKRRLEFHVGHWARQTGARVAQALSPSPTSVMPDEGAVESGDVK